MTTNPFLGVLFHAIGGLAAGSFYIPFKRVRGWAWETYWVTGGLFIWVICPLIAALATVENPPEVYREASWSTLIPTFLCGVGWGIGHLTFGLSLRYLGMSLGMGLSLGFCTFFGALIPPIFKGTFLGLFGETAGRWSLSGLAVCLVGIFFCSWAGMSKERELPEETKRKTVAEFNFFRGVWVAFFAGVMSACFAFGIEAGDALQELARQQGAKGVYANNAPLLLVLAGGGLSNIIWCVTLNIRNGSGGNYIDRSDPLVNNYLFCTIAGVVAYAEFFFFGMGETQMGKFSVFASWPIHMAFIIVFSNIWGLVFHEWKGTSTRTKWLLVIGLVALAASTFVSSYGSWLKQKQEQTQAVSLYSQSELNIFDHEFQTVRSPAHG
jgi:L-rhamnose-H+ transport protein